MRILSKSPHQTIKLGRWVGKLLEAGDVVGLIGELGTGKTTMVKGIAEGLGVENSGYITSPSFVIVKEYAGRLPLYHFDLYRLDNRLDVERIGYEEYFYGHGVTIVEWAQKIKELLPKVYLRVEFKIEGRNERSIKLIPKGSRYRKLVKMLEPLNHVSDRSVYQR